MLQPASYAQPLRAIGQALEILGAKTFEVESEGEDFLIRATVETSMSPDADRTVQDSAVQHIWGLRPARSAKAWTVGGTEPVSVSTLNLRYTPNDLDRLENEGRARRSDPQGMADAANLSQFLRTIGAYLYSKRARLLKILRADDSVTIVYETAAGQTSEEVLSASSLYDFWVRMYMKRADRRDA